MFGELNNLVAITFRKRLEEKSKHSHVSCLKGKTEHPPKSLFHHPGAHSSAVTTHYFLQGLQVPD